ncbi:hypothetical protein HPQ64_15125 [Rhizobiales bacterium]|uniref:YHS domain-containing (seleno)protein n=1 Tax=Hongsoonwoonella zoysiae TaxID=2821844 RepID=UPI001560725F|nr:YHS domain-containing (seleno)protein [Hongsoonwoonella zoysiae]NRG19023.1 hypothetical protein [Hongsoonwoonella zoysiae]
MKRLATTSFLTMTLMVFFAAESILFAGEVINARPGGLAVKGYDVVAYFTEGRPTLGREGIEHTWQGIRWRFANQKHLTIFAEDPVRYAPRYGGFCAGGVAIGNLAPIDPEAFVIIDGRLYLNYDKPTRDEFAEKAEESVAKADANWKRIGQTE